MKPGTLVIRADASVAMGTGHAMRCLALAQAWQDSGGEVIFAAVELTSAITLLLQNERIEILSLQSGSGSADDAHELAALAQEREARWVVVDGYQFDSEYQRRIKEAGLRLLFIDDTGQCGTYCADLILNQNVYACEEMYFRDPATKVLLGPHYALLRREFSAGRGWNRNVSPVVQNLLITMGGSDPENFTARVIRAVQDLELKGVEIAVVIGGSNAHLDSWRQLQSQGTGKIQLRIDVKNMAGLMADADLAISAAGTTCYELALLQAPMVLVSLAQNQVPTVRALANAGAAVDAGWFGGFDDERFTSLLHNALRKCELRRSLAENARRLVDGLGARRVCQFLRDGDAARSKAVSALTVGAP